MEMQLRQNIKSGKFLIGVSARQSENVMSHTINAAKQDVRCFAYFRKWIMCKLSSWCTAAPYRGPADNIDIYVTTGFFYIFNLRTLQLHFGFGGLR